MSASVSLLGKRADVRTSKSLGIEHDPSEQGGILSAAEREGVGSPRAAADDGGVQSISDNGEFDRGCNFHDIAIVGHGQRSCLRPRALSFAGCTDINALDAVGRVNGSPKRPINQATFASIPAPFIEAEYPRVGVA